MESLIMPIHEYRCESCGEQLEKLQRMNDDPLVDCPACGAPALKRLVSAASFRLKGSGWYETDFKKGNRHNLAEAADNGTDTKKVAGCDSKKDSKKTGASSTTSSDPKTTAKPPAKAAAKSENVGAA